MITKQIPNYPDYEISEYGDVFSNKGKNLIELKHLKHKCGYLFVRLPVNGSYKTEYIHRLVLMTFDRSPKKGEVCRHFPDRDKSNNHISNLKWGTHQENMDDRWFIHKINNTPKSEKHWMCKLSNKEVQEIRDLYSTGNYTQKNLAGKYAVSKAHICDIVNNKTRIL